MADPFAHVCLYWLGGEVHLDIEGDDPRDIDTLTDAFRQALVLTLEHLDANPRQPSEQSIH